MATIIGWFAIGCLVLMGVWAILSDLYGGRK